MIFHKNNDTFLSSLAVKNNLDMDKLLSAYLKMGEKFLFLLHVFEGCELHIPSKRRLCSPSLYNIQFIEDDNKDYEDYKKGDIICYKENSYKIVSNETKILNHWYLAVIPYTDKKEEGVDL